MITKEKLVKWIMEEEGLEVGQKFKIKGNVNVYHWITKGFEIMNTRNEVCDLYICGLVGREIIKLKDPYTEFCTVEEIKELGIKIEVDQKVLACDEVNSILVKSHYCNNRNESFQCWCEGGTSWSVDNFFSWKYIKLVR